MIKLIALDLDGTLLNPQGEITLKTKQAIAQARKAGVRVVLNTGRPIQEAVYFTQKAGCDDLFSALGGAAIADGRRGVTLQRWDIPENSARQVLKLCLGRKIALMIFAEEQIVLDPFSKDAFLRTYPYPVFHQTAVVTEDPAAYLQQQNLSLTKIHGEQNPTAYPIQALSRLEGIGLTSGSPLDFEVIPAGVDKGRALERLAESYGVCLEECAAVGDGENDLPMLRAAGLPVAMGNAVPEVKEAVKHITASNDQDGAAAAIWYILARNGEL